MTEKRNAKARTLANQGLVDVSHHTGITPINQVLRLPSAARYFLNRHAATLSPHAEGGNDDAAVMLALVTALLDSDDMLAGTR